MHKALVTTILTRLQNGNLNVHKCGSADAFANTNAKTNANTNANANTFRNIHKCRNALSQMHLNKCLQVVAFTNACKFAHMIQ